MVIHQNVMILLMLKFILDSLSKLEIKCLRIALEVIFGVVRLGLEVEILRVIF